MISAIFQPEVSTLESQVAVLQSRIALLKEAESVAGGSLEALKGAIAKVSSLAPHSIASLKSAVLSLFTGGDNSSDGGNQPINPEPRPSDDGEVEVATPHLPEPLTGQSYEWASPLCCQLEDAPQSSLQGQSVDVASVVSDAPEEMPYIDLIPIGHAVVYQRKTSTGEIICCYLGGNNKSRLKDWGSWLCNQHSVGSGFE